MRSPAAWYAFPSADTLQMVYQCMLQQAMAPGTLAANSVVDLPWYKVAILRQSQTVVTVAVVSMSRLPVACIVRRSTTFHPGSREVVVPSPQDSAQHSSRGGTSSSLDPWYCGVGPLYIASHPETWR